MVTTKLKVLLPLFQSSYTEQGLQLTFGKCNTKLRLFKKMSEAIILLVRLSVRPKLSLKWKAS